MVADCSGTGTPDSPNDTLTPIPKETTKSPKIVSRQNLMSCSNNVQIFSEIPSDGALSLARKSGTLWVWEIRPRAGILSRQMHGRWLHPATPPRETPQMFSYALLLAKTD